MKFKLVIDGKHYYPTRKTQISRKSVLNNLKSGYLRVEYQPGVFNDGDFTNKRDLIKALNNWTEPQLIEYAKGEGWN